ncbi:MAG: isopentenyl-diphosphate Delta-isomerase [Acidimicrobiia bacterium]
MSAPSHHDQAHDDQAHDEQVVLLDVRGRPVGSAAKQSVHTCDTPLHLGFSCYVVDRAGRVLLTKRAASKRTWPGVWTNACCGHPQPGETLRAAVARRLRDELGVVPASMTLVLPDFLYRAVMDNGVVEHELCPVIVAEVDGEPCPNPDEVGDVAWIAWETLCAQARDQPETLSPWSVAQIAQLTSLASSPRGLIERVGFDGAGLDTPTLQHAAPRPVDAGPVSWAPAGSDHAIDPFVPIRARVEDVLTSFVAAKSAELSELDPALGALTREIGALIGAGGKRLRPAFVHWGHRASGTHDDTGVAAVAAAVEMLHTFALLHDDVMDRSATRRGRPAAHQGLAEVHVADELAGDPQWFGTSAAILAGDLAFVWADELLDTAPLCAAALVRARRVFTTLRSEVMAGQYLDLRLNAVGSAGPSAASRVALLKSGRYTVTRPLELGLALAGDVVGATADALAVYGDALGVAFQMRDDILGLFGDPARTGKGCADDLRAGKRTVLILRALALASDAQRDTLVRALGDVDLDDHDAEECREIVARSGALASVETMLRAHHSTALAALAGVPEPARAALTALASDVVHRDC